MDKRPRFVARLLGTAGEMPVDQSDAQYGERKQDQPGYCTLLQQRELFGGEYVVACQNQSAKARAPQHQAVPFDAQVAVAGGQHRMNGIELLCGKLWHATLPVFHSVLQSILLCKTECQPMLRAKVIHAVRIAGFGKIVPSSQDPRPRTQGQSSYAIWKHSRCSGMTRIRP